ncbi:MAG: hypothetical protein AAGB93_22045 [Planctomycetota bacterium]
MIRRALALSMIVASVSAGTATSLVQVDNYEAAAELDRLSREAEWNARRCSGLRVELERFEFDLDAEHTRRRGAVAARPSR